MLTVLTYDACSAYYDRGYGVIDAMWTKLSAGEGGRRRAEKMPARERHECAVKAALARWSGSSGRVEKALAVLDAWLKAHPGSTFADRGLVAIREHYEAESGGQR